LVTKEIQKKINVVKLILDSKEDGAITISAYDTAWVALVKNVEDTNSPQFPSCIEWIANNQLHDGSWGDAELFIAHDRILNTLACVLALRSWNMHPQKCEKGNFTFMNLIIAFKKFLSADVYFLILNHVFCISLQTISLLT